MVSDALWSLIGFYSAPDHEYRGWRFSGSEAGLSLLPALISRVSSSGKEHISPIEGGCGFNIRVWERPGIDDEGVYGPPEDLERLAELLEARLAGMEEGDEFRIDTEYAADAEYALVVRMTSRAFSQPSREPDNAGLRQPGTEEVPFGFPALAFWFQDEDGEEETEGLLRITDEAVFIEYRVGDDDDDFLARAVLERDIPIADIASVTYKRGVFGPLVTLQTHHMKALEDLPVTSITELTLRFKRRDRDVVERMVAAMDSLIREGP